MIEYITQKKSLLEAVELAYSELEILGQEMRDAYDNTPENLQGSAVGEAREEAASALEDLSQPSVPKLLEDIEVTWQERTMTSKRAASLSRSDRRDAAINILDAVADALDKKLSTLEDLPDETDGKLEQTDETAGFREEIGDLRDNAESVDFPGQRG